MTREYFNQFIQNLKTNFANFAFQAQHWSYEANGIRQFDSELAKRLDGIAKAFQEYHDYVKSRVEK